MNLTSDSLKKFIQSVTVRNKRTAVQYNFRLSFFERFLKEKNKINLDELIQKIKSTEYNAYNVLNDYCIFLKNNYNIRFIILSLNASEELNPRKFKLKVKIPKVVLKHKEAIDKEDIIKILNGCSELRLKTFVMLLASTGLRTTEALSIRLKDLDVNSNEPRLIIRGEYTKTKIDRYVFLTKEVKEQIKIWVDYKYRKRRICYKDKETEKTITEYRIPEKKSNELLFSITKADKPRPEILYVNLATVFARTLDRIGMGKREDENEKIDEGK